MRRLLVCSIVIGLGCGACQKPAARLNAPPHVTTDETSPMRAEFAQMEDNALLADMCVTDAHFVPQRAMLNSLGEERLGRLAALLEMYGGNVRFSTDETDRKLTDARTERIRAYLAEAGIDTTAERVATGLPGSRGMDAAQAILIKANEGTYIPKKKSGSAGATVDTTGNKPGQ